MGSGQQREGGGFTIGALTISRQVGSRGDELAALVARQLNWNVIGREMINAAAVAAGVPQVALAEVDELGLLGIRPSAREWRAYRSQVERIIREAATAGSVVIIGRGGQVVLRGWPGVLHVRVVAPLAARLGWLQQERQLTEAAARACLDTSSRLRARYVRRCYHANIDDATLYHLVINTGLVELGQATRLIIHTLEEIGGR